MKLTKQIGKNVLVCMLALTSMTGMVFASGSNEVSTSSVIPGNSWAGVIDGIGIDLAIDVEKNIIEGEATNLTNGDLSMVQLSIVSAHDSAIASVVLGTPGDLEFHESTIKENTTVLAAGSSVPIMFYLTSTQTQELMNDGWKTSIDSDNAPKFGLYEKGEVLVNKAQPLHDAYTSSESGVQTVVSYSYEDEGFSGTITNYTNKVVDAIETNIVLNNGEVFTVRDSNVQPGETVSLFYGAGISGFSMYAVETIIK